MRKHYLLNRILQSVKNWEEASGAYIPAQNPGTEEKPGIYAGTMANVGREFTE